MVAAGAVLVLVASRIPTIDDARRSSAICRDFLRASRANGLNLKEEVVRWSATRGETTLIVTYALREQEREMVAGIVAELRSEHPGCRIVLEGPGVAPER